MIQYAKFNVNIQNDSNMVKKKSQTHACLFWNPFIMFLHLWI